MSGWTTHRCGSRSPGNELRQNWRPVGIPVADPVPHVAPSHAAPRLLRRGRAAREGMLPLALVAALLLLAGSLLPPGMTGIAPSSPILPHLPAHPARVASGPIGAVTGPAVVTPGLWRAELRSGMEMHPAGGISSLPWGGYRAWLPPTPSASSQEPAVSCPTEGPINLTGSASCVISVTSSFTSINVQDNATLVFETPSGQPRVVVTVAGSVTLRGNGLLYVNHTDLRVAEAYDAQYSLAAYGSARFIVFDSNVTSDGFLWSGAFLDTTNQSILGTNFEYPVGSGWFTDNLIDRASLNLLQCYCYADLILLDNPAFPSNASIHATQADGFNVWLNFKQGSSVSASFPGRSWTGSWNFPGSGQVSGVNYTVGLVDCQVLFFALMLWQGSNVTLVDSPDVVLSFNVQFGSVTLHNLSEAHYSSFAFFGGMFSLRMRNTTVFTWNVYPLAGATTVWDSQVGEIQMGTTGALAMVHRGNLTGHGGYYGDKGTSTLDIFDSQISGQVVQSGGNVLLQNDTIDTTVKSPAYWAVLAAGTGSILAIDTHLAPQDVYYVIPSSPGRIFVAWSLHVNVTSGGSPVPHAAVRVGYVDDGKAVGNATLVTDGGGRAVQPLVVTSMDSLGSSSHNTSDNLSATHNLSWGARTLGAISHPTWVDLDIQSLIVGTSPANGSTGVPVATSIELRFRNPMDPLATAGAVTLAPATSFQVEWDASDHNLTLVPHAPLAPMTSYVVQVSTEATTQEGAHFPMNFTFSFATAALPLAVELSENRTSAPLGTSVLLIATVTGGTTPYTFFWTLNGTNVSTTSVGSLVVTPSHPGNYTYSVGVKDAHGSWAQGPSVVLQVLPRPSPENNTGSPVPFFLTPEGLVILVVIGLGVVVAVVVLLRRNPRTRTRRLALPLLAR